MDYYISGHEEKIKVTIMGAMYESTLKVNFDIKYIQNTWISMKIFTNFTVTTFFKQHYLKKAFFYISPEGGFSLDLRSADKELKAVTPEK